jgi:HEAT repeat protein
LAVTVALPARAAAPPATTLPASSPGAGQAALGQAEVELLRNSRATQDQRDDAALKLVATRDEAVRGVLVEILTGTDTSAQLAVARALGQIAWPDPQFIEPLFQLLVGREAQQERVTAAAAALAQYRSDPDVLKRLTVVANSNQSDNVRVPVILAIAAFNQKLAAQTLIDLQQRQESAAVERAAGDALMDMTGMDELGHNAQAWKQWWSENAGRSEADFAAEIRRSRADAFEREVSKRRQLGAAVNKLLTDLYGQAAGEERGAMVSRYLHSSAPEVRALGANIVYQSRDTREGPPPGTMKLVRGMLDDASAQVRAAAAEALFGDAESAPAMVQRLGREQDDMVLAALIHSLAPLHDPAAVAQMLQWVQANPSLRVRLEAAEGIRQGADLLNRDRTLQRQAVQALLAALRGTGQPGTQALRTAVVGALAALDDPRLRATFQELLDPHEPQGVRQNALRGLGNLQDPEVSDLIASYMDDSSPEIRLAAVQALGTVVQPIFVTKLLSKMNDDPDDSVRSAAWQVLLGWIPSPSMGEHDLAAMADALKTRDPAKRLAVLLTLRDRLVKDVQGAADEAQRRRSSQDLATEQQNIADLMMDLSQYSSAAEQYQAALGYWKANNGQPYVIDTLCGGVVRALLKAQKWNDAASFASAVIQEYDNNPQMKQTQETVGREFTLEAGNLYNSDDPSAYDKAMALLAATRTMNPPLKGSYPAQLEKIERQFQQKHASGRSGTAPS